VTEEDLREAFAEAGDATGVRIAEDREGRRRGFAFVEFGTLDEAQAALACDGKDMGGRTMRVDVTARSSRTRAGQPPTGQRHAQVCGSAACNLASCTHQDMSTSGIFDSHQRKRVQVQRAGRRKAAAAAAAATRPTPTAAPAS
jgi:RNA recognition motif-containing protein